MSAQQSSSSTHSSQKTSRRFVEGGTLRRICRQLLGWFTKDPGESASAEIERAEAISMAIAAKRLKAGAAKIAQLFGYWEDPEQWSHGTTKQELADLFDRVEPLSFSEIETVFQREFGKFPSELFQAFDETPFAAASLGQVHRALGHDGTVYAVKVQYPGIAEALQTDLETPDLVDALLGGSMGEGNLSSAKKTLCDAIRRELDYLQEAQSQLAFRERLAHEPAWVVPEVHLQLCSTKVLTSTKLEGEPLFSFLSKASFSEAQHIGTLLFRYGFETTLRHGLLNADPNPGNFLVLEGGRRLGLLDFGSALSLNQDQVRYEQVLWQSVFADDAETFRYTLHRMGVIPEISTFDHQEYRTWEALFCAPYQAKKFLFSKQYAKDLIAATGTLVRTHYMTWPASFILLFRQRLGLFSLLAHCNAPIEARSLQLHVLSKVGMAPTISDPLPRPTFG